MKLKEVNKSFSGCNYIIDINTFSPEADYTVRDKEYRIQFDNVRYCKGIHKMVLYKNLEITCWKEFIMLALI